MKIAKAALTVLTILAVIMASESALARGGGHGGRAGGHSAGSHSGGSHFSGRHFGRPRVSLGFVVGAPFGYYAPPYYYYPPYYPAIAAAPYAPPLYIEQGSSQPAPAQQGEGYWHYCAASQAYYPYVKECAEGWQLVAPQPPPG